MDSERIRRKVQDIDTQPGADPDAGRALDRLSESFRADLSVVNVKRHGRGSSRTPLATARGAQISLANNVDLSSRSGQEVLGHEVSHVLQQRAGRVAASSSRTVDVGLEREATIQGRIAAAGGRATIVGRSPSDDRRPEPTQPPEQPWIPAFLIRVGVGLAADAVTDAVEAKATEILHRKGAELSAMAQAELDKVSPSAAFMLRNGPAIISAYGYLKEFAAQFGDFSDEAQDLLMKELAAKAAADAGHPALGDKDIKLLVGTARIATEAALGVIERYALNIVEQHFGDAIDIAQEVATTVVSITGGVTRLTELARHGSEVLGAVSWFGRKGAAKQAAKAATGKKTSSEKVDAAADMIDEQNAKVEGKATKLQHDAGELRNALGSSDQSKRHDAYLAANLAGFGGAGHKGALSGVNAARDAFYAARAQGLDASVILSQTHAAGGNAFAREFLGSLVEDGGKLLVIKGIVYCIPGVGAVAEPLADAAGAMGRLLFDVYGDEIAEGTLWAINHPQAALQAGLDYAAWAGDVAAWAAANPMDAAWLGLTNVASASFVGATEFARTVIKYAGMLIDVTATKVVSLWEDPTAAATDGLKRFGGKLAKYAAMGIPGLSHLALLAEQIVNWLTTHGHLAIFAYHYLLTVGESYGISLAAVKQTVIEIFAAGGHDVSGAPEPDDDEPPEPAVSTVSTAALGRSVTSWQHLMQPYRPGMYMGMAGAALLSAQGRTMASTVDPFRFAFSPTMLKNVARIEAASSSIPSPESDTSTPARVRALSKIESAARDVEREASETQAATSPRIQLRHPGAMPFSVLLRAGDPMFTVGIYAQSTRLFAAEQRAGVRKEEE